MLYLLFFGYLIGERRLTFFVSTAGNSFGRIYGGNAGLIVRRTFGSYRTSQHVGNVVYCNIRIGVNGRNYIFELSYLETVDYKIYKGLFGIEVVSVCLDKRDSSAEALREAHISFGLVVIIIAAFALSKPSTIKSTDLSAAA